MTGYHAVPAERFTDLASGLGGPAAIGDLAAARRSKHLLLLRFLAEAGSSSQAIDVLIQADRRDPRTVAHLLGDPMVGAWAVGTTRRLLGHHDSGVPVSVDLAQLGALAAAAAFRTGMDAEVVTSARAGCVALATLGSASLPDSDGTAIVTVTGGRGMVSSGSSRVLLAGRDSRWRPLRRLAARHDDLVGVLTIEDGNPYRDCYHAPAMDRLDPDEARRWQDLFTEAWDLLGRFVPERAAELAAGLRSIVPLVTDGTGMARSGTARDAFGAAGLTRPRSAAELAITLVHEFQHSKLSALLDLIPLYIPGGSERHFAPWRTDARPTGGLIQGVYAFLGVADTWRALRAAPGFEARATQEFAVVRQQVEVGLNALESSTELTGRGRMFAAGLRAALTSLLADPVPRSTEAEATAALSLRRDIWIRHNPGMPSTISASR